MDSSVCECECVCVSECVNVWILRRLARHLRLLDLNCFAECEKFVLFDSTTMYLCSIVWKCRNEPEKHTIQTVLYRFCARRTLNQTIKCTWISHFARQDHFPKKNAPSKQKSQNKGEQSSTNKNENRRLYSSITCFE